MQMGTTRKTETKEKIALITDRINSLHPHFEQHKKDNHSRRGLLKLVGQRRKLLKYLQAKDEASYKQILVKLELRK